MLFLEKSVTVFIVFVKGGVNGVTLLVHGPNRRIRRVRSLRQSQAGRSGAPCDRTGSSQSAHCLGKTHRRGTLSKESRTADGRSSDRTRARGPPPSGEIS